MAESDDDAPVPADLADQIRERITGKAEAWDDALWNIVREQQKREAIQDGALTNPEEDDDA